MLRHNYNECRALVDNDAEQVMAESGIDISPTRHLKHTKPTVAPVCMVEHMNHLIDECSNCATYARNSTRYKMLKKLKNHIRRLEYFGSPRLIVHDIVAGNLGFAPSGDQPP